MTTELRCLTCGQPTSAHTGFSCPQPERESITIQSMSVDGDSLYLAVKDGDMNIGIENEEGCHSAYFDREQQKKLRDFLIEVLS